MHPKTSHHPTSVFRPIVGLLAVLLLATLGAVSLASTAPSDSPPDSEGPKTGATESTEASAVQTVPAPAGWRVYVDPETGELTSTPSPQQKRAVAEGLEAPLARSSEGLEIFELTRGGRGVNLQNRFQSALRVRVGEDGKMEMHCVDAEHSTFGEHQHEHPEGEHPDPATGAASPTPPVQPVTTTETWVER